jgi:hypothetical protein
MPLPFGRALTSNTTNPMEIQAIVRDRAGPAALVSGRYWRHLRQQEPASEAVDPDFQNKLVDKLREMTGVTLPRS